MNTVWTMSLSLLSVSTILLLFSFIGESPSFVPYKCQIQQEKDLPFHEQYTSKNSTFILKKLANIPYSTDIRLEVE